MDARDVHEDGEDDGNGATSRVHIARSYAPRKASFVYFPTLSRRFDQGCSKLGADIPSQGAGLKSYLMNAIPFGTVIIAPVAEGIVTAENLVKAVQKTKVDIGLFVPSLVLELSQNPELLDTCATQLELMLFCGGDLPQAIGDIVAQKIPLWCQYGASEIGLTPQLLDPRMVRSDWHCIKLHPCLGIEFRHVTEDLYELYVKRDAAKVETQPTFTELPDLHRLIEYGSRDLFSQHPFIPNVWKWRARADDIIVFLNGEKTNPTSMEQSVVATNAEVSGALVVGAQRFQAALLIEPVGKSGSLTTEEQAELIERIWPSIEEANALTPAHARIEKGLVLLTSPEKPMIRAGKGTIQRQATLAAYSDEIDQLYARMDVHAGAPVEDSQMPSDLINPEKVNAVVADSLKAVLQGKRFQDHEKLFVLGMDSLQSLQVLRRLKKALPLPELALSTIYSNPSVSELTRAIMSSAERVTASREAAMERLLNSLQERIAQIALPTRPTDVPSAQVVILTGSTGSLGTHLLRALIGNDSVRQIFCLNRRLDTMSDYCSRLRLAADGIAGVDKVTFLQTDLSKPHLGLDIETYKELCSDATLIIHSAWPVNFNLSLSSFSLQLEGLVNVFKLSASGRYCPGVFFCSSISSVSSLPDADGLVPETVVNSFDAPLRNGYAESKFLGELLCAAATTRLGVPTTIARIAQLGGPVNTDGLWNPSEWFSSLTISSMSLGAVPASLGSFLGHIDWLPVDIAADAIVEICFPKHADGPTASSDASAERLQVCHFVNPHPTKWELLLPSIVSVLKLQHRVEATILSPEAWLDEVRLDLEGMLTADDVDGAMLAARNPAAKLLEFYRANVFERMVRRGLACDETVKRSTALRSVPGVGRPWLEKWIAGWRSLSSET